MRALLTLVLSTLLALPAQGAISDADAINQAGRQRMLSQRMAKAFAQLALKVETPQAQGILAASVRTFETQLRTLQAHAPSAAIKAHYGRLDGLWLRYRETLAQPATPEHGRQVLQLSDELLSVAHAATVAWQEQAGTPQAELVNLAGRQRMLSQRLAKLYLFRAWGMAGVAEERALSQARSEFLAGLARLESAPLSTPRIQRELELARQQWWFFDAALAAGSDEAGRRDVATTSERILETMNTITALYEQLPAKQP
ncbi:type IV pili methyl-accepting chemotaxis transducer N-terminal domain-containing protein [Chitinimonas taiwanensis]|uniref:Type IV pili methyl-accepting chemotaxis transducer N-term n=1 Tax=Chitinimonas taiwanensis DSM 18899 TaxID=1121279 RepID=A0A1K2HIC4_9NEIS|nr:type IV pili methyl-accepting chemotaxis transducer N-terminal domain-containing protein [Chitinimonas taiwanensis]SFZ76592.1 Type IV pili methyl-accepting chemotaxis transducer N-term [Chitinimonas taiwanensis DSM 18899]